MKYLFTWLLFLWSGYVQAQSITGIKYWFNGNIDNGGVINNNYGTEANIQTVILTGNSIPVGFNNVTFQILQSNGKRSVAMTSGFYNSYCGTGASGFKYWFDGDISTLQFNSYTPADGHYVTPINTNLSTGFHTITSQYRTEGCVWSVPITETFYSIKGDGVSQYQYWFNKDFSNSKTGSLGSGESVVLNGELLDASSLANGFHQLNIRFKPGGGMWSVPQSAMFFKRGNDIVPIMDVTKFRYWFDDNNYYSRELTFRNLNDNDFLTSIETQRLSEGPHTISFQLMDNGNVWSAPLKQSFVREPIIDVNLLYPSVRITNSTTILPTTVLALVGEKYVPNGEVVYYISKENDPDFSKEFSKSADRFGKIAFDYPLNSEEFKVGIYNIVGKDLNNTHYTNTVRFYVSATKQSPTFLTALSPNANERYSLNQSILFKWSDKMDIFSSNLLGNSGSFARKYSIHYSKDNGPWQAIGVQFQSEVKSFANSITEFKKEVSFSQPGLYRIKVTNFDNQNQFSIGETFEVYNNDIGFSVQTEWDKSAPNPTFKPIGVAADGVSRILLAVSKNLNNPRAIKNATIVLSDDKNSSETRILGKLMPATNIATYNSEANSANLTTSTSAHIVNGEIWFWYVAPDDFFRTTVDYFSGKRIVNAKISVEYSDNTFEVLNNYPIEVVRPPLMLVHGLGGSEHTWDNFRYGQNGIKKNFTGNTILWRAGVKANTMIPDASFLSNARRLLNIKPENGIYEGGFLNGNSFQSYIYAARQLGYAATKVDYVCHSMGGDMARTVLNKLSSDYLENSSSLLRPYKNYGKGYINRLITINTPHNGSPLADFLVDINPEENQILKSLLVGAYKTKYDLISSYYNVKSNASLQEYNYNITPSKAVVDLQSTSGGIKFNETTIKNHLIAGRISNNDDCEKTFSEIANNFGNDKTVQHIRLTIDLSIVAYKLLKNYGESIFGFNSWVSNLNPDNPFGANTTQQLIDVFPTLACLTYRELGVKYGVSNFGTNSDLVVPLESQLAGLNVNYVGNARTIIKASFANHLSITDADVVGNRVLSLLNKPIESDYYANSIPASVIDGSQSDVYKGTNIADSIHIYYDSTKAVIRDVKDVYYIDSSYQIKVHIKDTAKLIGVSVIIQGQQYFSNLKAENQNFNLQIKSDRVGTDDLFVISYYDSSDFIIQHIYENKIRIATPEQLKNFVITPKDKFLNTGQNYWPQMNVVFNNFITQIDPYEDTFNVFIANPNIINFDSVQKKFIARDSGSTYAVVTFKGIPDTIFFNVIASPIGVVLPVKLIDFIYSADCNSVNLKWQTATENNNKGFEIEQKVNDKSWEKVALVEGALNAANGSKYDYRFNNLQNGKYQFRLKQIDNDGNFSYSNVLNAEINCGGLVNVSPNPAHAYITVSVQSTDKRNTQISISDAIGKQVLSKSAHLTTGSNKIEINVQNLAKGIYHIRITGEGFENKTFSFVKD